jgi:hypothetical protein
MSTLILESSTAYLTFVLCLLQSHHEWSKTDYVLLQDQSRDIAEVKLEIKHEITTEDHCVWLWAGECIIKIIMYRQRDMRYCRSEQGGNNRGTWSLRGQVCSYCWSLLLLLTLLFIVPRLWEWSPMDRLPVYPPWDFTLSPPTYDPILSSSRDVFIDILYWLATTMLLWWQRPLVSGGNTSVSRRGALSTAITTIRWTSLCDLNITISHFVILMIKYFG